MVQYWFFSMPANADPAMQEELNVFLRSHRVLAMHREFVEQENNSFWALAVEYLESASGPGAARGRSSKARVDYKEVLSPADFALFAKLREWRKQVAERESVPVYTILTNEQLAQVARGRPESQTKLREIEGVGEAKAGKYGEGILAVVGEASGQVDGGGENDEC